MSSDPQPVLAPPPPPPYLPLLLALALLFLQAFWNGTAAQLVTSSGWFAHRYGDEAAESLRSRDDSPERELNQGRLSLWATLLALPCWTLSLLVLVRASPHLSLSELGISRERWRQNLAAGFIGAAVLTPLVFTLNLVVLVWFRAVAGDSGDEHPFTRLARGGFGLDEWALLFFAAVVAAPIFEEVVFRGVLQPWCCRSHAASWFAMVLALMFAVAARESQMRDAWGGFLGGMLLAAAPALFVLALVPNLILLQTLGRTPAAAGVLATSVLFAAAHSRVWPTPVALTLLAIGIGAIAERTRNLLGPIVIHAIFNLVNCLLLAWGIAG